MEMRVRDLKSRDHQTDSVRLKDFHLCFSNLLGDRHQMGVVFGGEVDPVRDLRHWDNQRVSRPNRIDREESRATLIAIHKVSGPHSGENLGEDSTHVPGLRTSSVKGLEMPELPEVETVRRSLAEHLPGRTILQAEIRDPYVLRGQAPVELRTSLVGKTFGALKRHGKLLYFPFSDGSLIVHLGMTGQLTVRLPDRADTEFTRHETTGLERTLQHAPDKHTHISLALEGGVQVHYRDVRKFGRVYFVAETTREAMIRRFRLGVDPLSPSFDQRYLADGLKSRKTAIKAALLDQTFLAGLGNIYVDEALFLAQIRPGRGAYRVRGEQLRRLANAIPQVLEKGLAAGGTTLRDFVNGTGQAGYNQEDLKVYGRYGQPCPNCDTPLRRGEYGGRTTTWCPNCQV